MNLINKINFLQKSMNLSDHDFCNRFKMKGSNLKKWRSGISSPSRDDVSYLCKQFNLDINDFIDDTSSVSYVDLKEGEHLCRLNPPKQYNANAALEDFAREDNSRYEEKD